MTIEFEGMRRTEKCQVDGQKQKILDAVSHSKGRVILKLLMGTLDIPIHSIFPAEKIYEKWSKSVAGKIIVPCQPGEKKHQAAQHQNQALARYLTGIFMRLTVNCQPQQCQG